MIPSYLLPLRYTTSPLPIRQEKLLASYGFTCRCQRCSAESRVMEAGGASEASVTRALQEAYEEAEGTLRTEVTEAVEEGDLEALVELQNRLLGICRRSAKD